jgi:hypothetical protein
MLKLTVPTGKTVLLGLPSYRWYLNWNGNWSYANGPLFNGNVGRVWSYAPDPELGIYQPLSDSETHQLIGRKPKQADYDFQADLRHTYKNGVASALYLLSGPQNHFEPEDWRRVAGDTTINHENLDGHLTWLPSDWDEVVDYGLNHSLWATDNVEPMAFPPWINLTEVDGLANNLQWREWYGPEYLDLHIHQNTHSAYGRDGVEGWFLETEPGATGAWLQGSRYNTVSYVWHSETQSVTAELECMNVIAEGWDHDKHKWWYSHLDITSQVVGFTPDSLQAQWSHSIRRTAWITPEFSLGGPSNWSQTNGDVVDGIGTCVATTSQYVVIQEIGLMPDVSEVKDGIMEAAVPMWNATLGHAFPSLFYLEQKLVKDADENAVDLFETIFEFIDVVRSLQQATSEHMLAKLAKKRGNSGLHRLSRRERDGLARLRTLRQQAKDFGSELRSKFANLSLKDPPSTLDELADAHLMWKFGIAPLIKEGQALKNAIQQGIPEHRLRVQTTDRQMVELKGFSFDQELTAVVEMQPHASQVTEMMMWFDHYGALPTFERVWAVVPWSFAIDWVYPFGNILQGLDHSFIRTRLWDLMFRSNSEKLSIRIKPRRELKGRAFALRYRRFTSVNWGRPSDFRELEASFSAGHLPIALSLFWQVGKTYRR